MPGSAPPSLDTSGCLHRLSSPPRIGNFTGVAASTAARPGNFTEVAVKSAAQPGNFTQVAGSDNGKRQTGAPGCRGERYFDEDEQVTGAFHVQRTSHTTTSSTSLPVPMSRSTEERIALARDSVLSRTMIAVCQ